MRKNGRAKTDTVIDRESSLFKTLTGDVDVPLLRRPAKKR